MGENLTKAIEDLKHKHNFANLKEEYNYVDAVNEAIETLEGSGGNGGVTEKFVNDAVKVETDARILVDEALQENIDAISIPNMADYYDKTATDAKFITQTDGANAIKDFVTNTELTSALDTSSNFVAKDPSNEDAVTNLDAILANIYVTPASQEALSSEQMKELQDNILSELLKKIAK